MKSVKIRKEASEYFTIIKSGLSDTHIQGMEFIKPTKGLYICNVLIDIAGKGEYRRSCAACKETELQHESIDFN